MQEDDQKPRIITARTLARDLIKQVGIDSPPVMLKTLVAFLRTEHHIEIIPWDFSNNTDGIQVTEGHQITIGYNRNQHRHRQRFTVAHEIGHFMLGHTHTGSLVDLKSDKNAEIEANQFAAELLMPLKFMKAFIALKKYNAIDLAKLFDVSEESIWWRLMDTKLLNKM